MASQSQRHLGPSLACMEFRDELRRSLGLNSSFCSDHVPESLGPFVRRVVAGRRLTNGPSRALAEKLAEA